MYIYIYICSKELVFVCSVYVRWLPTEGFRASWWWGSRSRDKDHKLTESEINERESNERFSEDKRGERRDPTAVEIIRRDLCKLGCVSNTTYSVVSPFYLRTPSHHPITSFRLSSKLDLARCLFRKSAFWALVGQNLMLILFGFSHERNQWSLSA